MKALMQLKIGAASLILFLSTSLLWGTESPLQLVATSRQASRSSEYSPSRLSRTSSDASSEDCHPLRIKEKAVARGGYWDSRKCCIAFTYAATFAIGGLFGAIATSMSCKC